MNLFAFTGNLGKDAVVRNAGGTSVASFSVAVKSGYGDKEQTLWIDCSLWGKLAESRLVDYLNKGQRVEVTGELGTREHEGKTYLTCRVGTINLGGKSDNATPSQSQPSSSKPAQSSYNAYAAASGGASSLADIGDDPPF